MKQISTIFAILLLSLPFAQDRAVTITGNCLLEDETEHSGTEVHVGEIVYKIIFYSIIKRN